MRDLILAEVFHYHVVAIELDRKWQIKSSHAAIEEKLLLLCRLAVRAANLHESGVSLTRWIIMTRRVFDGKICPRARHDLQSSPVDAGANGTRLRIPFSNFAFRKINFDVDVHFVFRVKVEHRRLHPHCCGELGFTWRMAQAVAFLLDCVDKLGQVAQAIEWPPFQSNAILSGNRGKRA